jgi:WD40 repeat protein
VEHGKINGYGQPTGDATVTVRTVDTGAKLHEFKSEQPVTSSSLSGDGKTLVVTEGKKAIVRNADTGAKLHEFEHQNKLSSSSLSGDGKTLVTAEGKYKDGKWVDNKVIVRNVDTGAELQKFDHDAKITSTSLSGDGKRLVVVESEMGDGVTTDPSEPQRSTVIVRNVDTGVELQKFEHEKPVTSSSLSGDGKTLVTVESEMEYGTPKSSVVVVRDVATGVERHKFEHEEAVTSSSLSGDGKAVLYCSGHRAYFRIGGMDTDHWASALLEFGEAIKSVHFANDDRDLLITLSKTTIVFDYEHLLEQPTATDAYAMAKNDVEMAKRMLEAFPMVVNAQDDHGRTVLHMAVEEEQEKDAQKYVRLFCGIERQDDATLLACWEAYSADTGKSEQGTSSMIQGVFVAAAKYNRPYTRLTPPNSAAKSTVDSKALVVEKANLKAAKKLFETGFVPKGEEKKREQGQAVYHTPLTIAVAKNFDKVVQDLLGIVLASTSTCSRLYVTESLPLLVKEHPKHVTSFLNALGLDSASAPVEPWRQDLGGQYKVRTNSSSFAVSEAAWRGTEDDKKGNGVTTTLRTCVEQALSKCIPNSGAELPVEPRVVGLEGIATNTALLHALCECKHLELFETTVVKAVLKWKWQHHGRGMHTAQFALYVLFVLLYSLWLYGIHTRYEYWDKDHGGDMQLHFGSTTGHEFQRGVLLIALLFLGNEAVQILAQQWNYAAMGWNAKVDGVNAKVDGVNAKVDEILKLLAKR